MIFMWLMTTIVIDKTSTLKLSYQGKKKGHRLMNLSILIRDSYFAYKSKLCMNKHTLNILCKMVMDIEGLTGATCVPVEET